MKTFNYCELIKIRLDDNIDSDIINEYYPGTITDDICDYDYRIVLDNLLINTYLLPKNCEIYKPFKSSNHAITKEGERIICYSLKSPYSNPYLCIRTNNTIIVSLSDNNMINIVRIIAELITRKLLEKGFYPVHASSTINNGKSNLYFGASGSGKSTMFFKDICINSNMPQSNDITFIGYEDGILKSYSTGFDVSFSSLLLGEKKEKKIRYTPNDFCNQYGKIWVHKCEVNGINYTNLDLEHSFHEESLKIDDVIKYLKLYGKDFGFEFYDIFRINFLKPEYTYEKLDKKLEYKIVTGNIKK